MKRLLKTITAVVLAVLMGTVPCVKALAAKAEGPDYIKEVKLFYGDPSQAAAEGYTLLKDGDNPADLNQKAGGGIGSKGNVAVYLGYKTTKKASEAITDLAVMNMKGGYDVAEYEALFEAYIKSQVIPMTEKYIDMLQEYRTNYNSKANDYNKARATYVHDILNFFEDDDTGKTLGDLFLNETKEELGEAYDKLSAAEKKNHADLTTIISQSNGNATLLMQSLLARASDTNTKTFIERFASQTYDDLIDATGLTPTDAKKQLAKLYDDGAQLILDTWDDLKDALDGYDDAVKTIENYDKDACDRALEAFKNLDSNSSEKEINKVTNAYNQALKKIADVIEATQTIAIHDKLDEIDYDDETLLDFFTQTRKDVKADITVLYPFVAALSDGQKAGLEFISLKELLLISLTDTEGYKNTAFDNLTKRSIYEGVDRAIYTMGGVALTSDARRTGVIEEAVRSEYEFSLWSYVGAGVAFLFAAAAVESGVIYGTARNGVKIAQKNFNEVFESTESMYASEMGVQEPSGNFVKSKMDPTWAADVASSQRTARIWGGVTFGFSVAFVIIAGITAYLTYKDMQEFYHVDFTPIPHYMVDAKDIIGYNRKGEKIMLKNQSAYYKAVACNRAEDDENYKVLGTSGDLNGDVGKQWLALYAVKKDLMDPILASSLKVVVGSTNIPAGYETGIHMFGSDAAFNLNSNIYVWNYDAPSVYVYFQTDDGAKVSTTGTNFSGGMLALVGGAGALVGAAATILVVKLKKKKTAVAVNGKGDAK